MKSNLMKWLAGGLSILLVLACMACTPKEDPADTTTAGDEVTTDDYEVNKPDIEVKNYNKDFNIITPGFADEWLVYTESDGGTLEKTVYERGIRIRDHLGVTLTHQDAGDWIAYSSAVKRSVMAGDDDYQLVMTHVYQGITDLMTSNACYDIGSLESVDLEKPYWNKPLMEDLTVGGQYLLGYGDLCLANTYCILFNKDLMEEYNMTAPYQLVRSKAWTLDALISMASNVARDNGDQVWDEKDTYGITGWGHTQLISFVTSSDLKIVDRDENGLYKIAYDNNPERMLALYNTVFEMFNAEYSYFWGPYATTTVDFAAGTSLFQLYSTVSLPNLRDADVRFGILPYPMFNAKQGAYKSLNWGGMMVVPASIQDPTMVGEVLELMQYYTAPVKTAYFEDLLGTKLANAPEDAEMLEIIWDSRVSDVGLIVCNANTSMGNLVYMVPDLCNAGNSSYTSYLKKYRAAAQRGLDRVFDQ